MITVGWYALSDIRVLDIHLEKKKEQKNERYWQEARHTCEVRTLLLDGQFRRS